MKEETRIGGPWEWGKYTSVRSAGGEGERKRAKKGTPGGRKENERF